MLKTISVEGMRGAERRAFGAGVSPLLLMENAARAAYQILKERFLKDPKGKKVLFLCGNGNNGGDGLAMARLLWEDGGKPRVYLTGESWTEEAKTNLAHLRALGIPVYVFREEPEEKDFSAVVDAVFGTGFHGGISADSTAGRMLEFGNRIGNVLSVDIPSGMEGDTGRVFGVCAAADITVTFHRPKAGLYLTSHREFVGNVKVVSIGLPDAFDDEPGLEIPGKQDFYLPSRPINAHKGDCGRTLLYCGSMGMAGAAAMSARAALKAGAGLVTVLCPSEIIPILQTIVPNAMCLPENAENLPACNGILAGCGLAENEQVFEKIQKLLAFNVPTVLDAGALNLLSRYPMKLNGNVIVTPHAGEAARLLHKNISEITDNLPGAAEELRENYGCAVLLKSSVSVILPFEGVMSLNVAGSPALARGGSGDALAGILVSLLAQGLSQKDAMSMSALWLGLAGEKAAERGVRGVLTGDVIDAMEAV